MKKTLALFLAMLLLLCMAPLVTAEEELPTLRVLGTYNAHDPNNDPTATAIEEKTGYHVEYFMLPVEDDLQNLLMQIGGGEKYDILRISETMYLELLSNGMLLPLDDLLAEYGDNLTTLITEDAYTLTTGEDGKIYGIPMMAERASIDSGVVVRGDVLEELGLDVPTTAEEFKAVLQAVKEAKPDMIPFLTKNEARIGVISSGFGFYFDWNEADGKLANQIELPAYREYLAYMADLYAEGLLDPDIAVNNETTRTEKLSSGNVFAYACGGWTDAPLTALIDSGLDVELIYLPPFTDAQGNAGIKKQQALNNVSCIPKTAENPEHAVRFMNRKLDEDVFTYITIGTEGETFTIDEEGNYWPIMPIFTELRNNAWWYLNSFDMTCYGDMWMARTRRTEAVAEIYDGLNQYEALAVSNPTDLCPTLPVVAENKAALETMVNDYVLQVIVGVRDIADHDAFVEEWYAAGGQASTDAYNEWYQNR